MSPKVRVILARATLATVLMLTGVALFGAVSFGQWYVPLEGLIVFAAIEFWVDRLISRMNRTKSS